MPRYIFYPSTGLTTPPTELCLGKFASAEENDEKSFFRTFSKLKLVLLSI